MKIDYSKIDQAATITHCPHGIPVKPGTCETIEPCTECEEDAKEIQKILEEDEARVYGLTAWEEHYSGIVD